MVSASIDMIARSNKITTDELRTPCCRRYLILTFRKQIREEIIAQRLREREVDSKIIFAESEVDASPRPQKQVLPVAIRVNITFSTSCCRCQLTPMTAMPCARRESSRENS